MSPLHFFVSPIDAAIDVPNGFTHKHAGEPLQLRSASADEWCHRHQVPRPP
jgi:hypothetical protein